MIVQELLNAKLGDNGIAEDLQTVLREAGVLDARVLNPQMELQSHLRSSIEILVELERGRTLLDLVSLEGELQLLLGNRVNLLTKGSLAAQSINEAIKNSVQLNV